MAKDISGNLQSGTKADFPAKAREAIGGPNRPAAARDQRQSNLNYSCVLQSHT